jgi:homoserine kinase type II
LTEFVRAALATLNVGAQRILTMKDVADGNSSWAVEADGEVVVLRRYSSITTRDEVLYEHRVLDFVERAGWTVPAPRSELRELDGRLFCLTRFVPGEARSRETTPQRVQRGEDLARLDIDMRSATDEFGQRPGWRALHQGTHVRLDWETCITAFARVDARLADWVSQAKASTKTALDAMGAADLPLTMIHGDFAEWNVHYAPDGALAGVVDFDLAHVDSRPYELAIARTYRSPETLTAYVGEIARLGWPLSDLEIEACPLIERAFRADMAAWELDSGLRSGVYDLPMIVRQLERTGSPAP